MKRFMTQIRGGRAAEKGEIGHGFGGHVEIEFGYGMVICMMIASDKLRYLTPVNLGKKIGENERQVRDESDVSENRRGRGGQMHCMC